MGFKVGYVSVTVTRTDSEAHVGATLADRARKGHCCVLNSEYYTESDVQSRK